MPNCSASRWCSVLLARSLSDSSPGGRGDMRHRYTLRYRHSPIWLFVRLGILLIAGIEISISIHDRVLEKRRLQEYLKSRDAIEIKTSNYTNFEAARLKVDIYYDQIAINRSRGIVDQSVLSNYYVAFQEMLVEYTNMSGGTILYPTNTEQIQEYVSNMLSHTRIVPITQ
jgi:hypothetical protein